MIRQVIDVNGYWEVIVYYNVDYNLFNYIYDDLRYIGASNRTINRVYKNMKTRRAKAVTVTGDYTISVVLFNTHENKYDYLNSIVHEAEHVKQAMLDYYDVVDAGEAPAYTIGYLVMKMLQSKIISKINIKNT